MADPEVADGSRPGAYPAEPLDTAPLPVAGARGPDAAAALRLVPRDPSPALDRVAELAARLLGAPSAQVSLLTDVQHIVGGAGVPDRLRERPLPADQSICLLTAEQQAPLILPDTRNEPRVAGLDVVRTGLVGAYLGTPLVADDGHVIGALCVYGPHPKAWTDGDVTMLGQLAATAIAELERSALAGEFEIGQVRWELAADAAMLGTFDLDVRTGRLSADDRLLDMFGLDPDTYDGRLEDFRSRVHPDDIDATSRSLQHAVATAGPYEAEYRVVLPDRTVRWIRARGRALLAVDGRPARVIGAAFDTTEIRESQGRVFDVLETMPSGYLALDRDWRITYANAEATALAGRSRAELAGSGLWDLFPELVGTEFETAYRQVLDTGRPANFEAFHPAPIGAWFEVRVAPAPDGLSVYFVDISQRHSAEELRATSASVAEKLLASRDVESTVRQVARRVCPRLGDWSLVSLIGDDGTISDLASWPADPARRELVARYVTHRFAGRREPGPTSQAARSARPVLTTDALSVANRVIASPEALAAIRELAPESILSVPVLTGDRVVAVVSICRGADRPSFDEAEIATAQEIAKRAGDALGTARALDDQQRARRRLSDTNRRLKRDSVHDREVSRALQAAMTPVLPVSDDLTIAGRYLTASSPDQVGGDWYDAIRSASGAMLFTIGDVMGHDVLAAGVMGELRNMLRAFAWDHDDQPPSTLIGRLDRAMHDLQVTTMATLALVRVEPAVTADGVRTLRWSNAGHPRPILLTADGAASFLDGPPDAPVSVDPALPRVDHTQQVPSGSTLLLYTDGLVETRDLDFDERHAQLLDVVRRHRHLEPAPLLDAVVHDMVGGRPADDVAMLVVRFHDPRA